MAYENNSFKPNHQIITYKRLLKLLMKNKNLLLQIWTKALLIKIKNIFEESGLELPSRVLEKSINDPNYLDNVLEQSSELNKALGRDKGKLMKKKDPLLMIKQK